jgi:hypothetical protein
MFNLFTIVLLLAYGFVRCVIILEYFRLEDSDFFLRRTVLCFINYYINVHFLSNEDTHLFPCISLIVHDPRKFVKYNLWILMSSVFYVL